MKSPALADALTFQPEKKERCDFMKCVFQDGVERDIYRVSIQLFYYEHDNGQMDFSYVVFGHYGCCECDVIRFCNKVEDAISLHKELMRTIELENDEALPFSVGDASDLDDELPFPEVVNE